MQYTHYDYLDIAPGASPDRIEEAYELIKHRLNGVSDDALVRMIHEAYSVLSDPSQRHAYDADLQRAAAKADAELREALDRQQAPPPRRVQDVPAPLLTAMTAWAA